MTNRKLVQGLISAYAGFVVGVTVLGSSVNLLGSTLNFFTDPTSTQRLAEFDDDGDSVPDLINGPRILEIFRSAPNIFAPLFGHPTMVPNMIRLDDAFEMPATSTHPAAPVMNISEPTGAFDAVAPKWSPEEIRVSNEFNGGTAAPGIFLVPIASPSSSLPATLMPPPLMPASVSSVSSTAPTSSSTTPALTAPPSSTPPVVTAPPSSTPPVVTAPPSSTPPTASSVSTMSAPPASAAAATTSASMPPMPSSTMEDTTQTSSPMSMDCDGDGSADDMCDSMCESYWTDVDGDTTPDSPAGCS